MLDEILQDSWTYQKIQQKGVEKGHEEGLKEGIEVSNQKLLKYQRELLVGVVKGHFPALLQLATERAQQVHDPEVLQQVLTQILAVQMQSEVEDILTHIN